MPSSSSSSHLPSLLRPGSSPLTPYLPPWLLAQPRIALALGAILLTLCLSSAVAPEPLSRCEVIQEQQGQQQDDQQQQEHEQGASSESGGVERIVILGASSGCGADLALAYAREVVAPHHPRRGVKLLLVARRQAELERVKERVEREVRGSCAGDGVEVQIMAGDVSRPEDVLRAVEFVSDRWRGVDTVHLLAGLPSTETLVDAASSSSPAAEEAQVTPDSLTGFIDEARRLYDVNCLGTLIATAAFVSGPTAFLWAPRSLSLLGLDAPPGLRRLWGPLGICSALVC